MSVIEKATAILLCLLFAITYDRSRSNKKKKESSFGILARLLFKNIF